MIPPGPGAALVALSTLCTVVYLGLGFLPRPSRAAAVWSIAFVGSMISSYLWVAADAADAMWLRAASTGVMLGMVSLVWLGLRVRRGAAPWHRWVALPYLVVAPVVLVAFADTDAYLTVVRVVFVASIAFPILTIAELIRLGPLLRDESLPLTLMSTLSVVLSALGLVQEVVRLATGGPAEETLQATRDYNSIGALLYLVSAMVTLLLLTRQQTRSTRDSSSPAFEVVAADRLARAEAAGDRWWSVLVVRLDDPEALRNASSTNAFDQIAAGFAADVRRALPADSDIDQRGATEFVVLLPRPEGAVRQVLVGLLAAVAEGGASTPLAVRMSASVGWAPVDTVGYALHELTAAASSSAEAAQVLGGDQWHRAGGPVGHIGRGMS